MKHRCLNPEDQGMDRLLRFPRRTKQPQDRRLRATRVERARPRMAIVTTIADAQWQFMRGQNRFLADSGFELHGIASPSERLHELADRDDIDVHAVEMSREIKPLADLVALARMIRTLRRLKPDVLHVSTPKAALLGSIAGWLTGVPVRVFLVRGLITDGARGFRKRLLRAAEALTVRLCHASYFTSRSLRSSPKTSTSSVRAVARSCAKECRTASISRGLILSVCVP
jgi:hypothetical protein